MRARASEHSSNFCEQFEQRPNFAGTFKFDGTIRYPLYCFYLSDDMGPQVLFCPTSFTIRATKQTAIVNWDVPIFKDNSLGNLEPECNRQSGESFYWGDWNIYCRAYDNNPNNEPAVCHFVVTVKRKWRHFLTRWVLALKRRVKEL